MLILSNTTYMHYVLYLRSITKHECITSYICYQLHLMLDINNNTYMHYVLYWLSIGKHACITSYIGHQQSRFRFKCCCQWHVFWQACGVARLAALRSICREAAITAEHVALVEHEIRSSHGLCDFGRFGPGLVACYQREGPNHARAS